MALASLDNLLAKKKNQKALMDALEKDLLKDPVLFFKTVIMPLLPREAKLSFDNDGVIQWKSLIGVSVEPAACASTASACHGEQVALDSEEKIAATERASHIGAGSTIDVKAVESSRGQ